MPEHLTDDMATRLAMALGAEDWSSLSPVQQNMLDTPNTDYTAILEDR